MSEQTYQALEDAIRAHVGAEAEGDTRLITDWYLITASISDEPEQTHYLHASSRPMPTHVMYGLVSIAHHRVSCELEPDDD